MNDAPHLIEPLRVQVVGHLDVFMVLPSTTASQTELRPADAAISGKNSRSFNLSEAALLLGFCIL